MRSTIIIKILKKLLLSALFCSLPISGFATDMGSNVNTHPLQGTVALTFDDGPNPIYTPQILAILKKYNIKATFFVVGMNVQKYPDIVKLAAAEGHLIENHSLTHPMLTQLNDTELLKEIVTPQNIIYNLTGKKPLCLRYPFSASNQHIRNVILIHGIVPIPIGFNSYDYTHPGVDKIVSRIVKNARSGTVILLHDGFDQREQTVAALPQIIEGIKKKGLGFSQICMN